MDNQRKFRLIPGSNTAQLVLFVLFVIWIAISIIVRMEWLVFIPAFVLLSLLLLLDIKWIYYILILTIPLSIELEFGGLSLDAPDEIICIFLFLITPGAILLNYRKWDWGFLRHPIVMILGVMAAVSIMATLQSTNVVLSIKYLLAKAWYIIAYFGCTVLFLRKPKDIRFMSWLAVISCTITIMYVVVRHAGTGFSFNEINYMVGPFYSNHVNYAVQMVAIIPFLWLLWRHYKKIKMIHWLLFGLMILFICAIYLSYTRAAILTLILSLGFYYVIQWKLVKPAFWLAIIGSIGFSMYMVRDDRFFELAPDFNKTITQQQFDRLITATYNLEDISTMERVYRWVAARYMIPDRPLLGVGPNNFYDNYKPYTINSFRTYVSDNPEHSTVHSYILLLAIEQGIPAALLFLALIYFTLISLQTTYHSYTDRESKLAIMAAGICFFNLIMVLLINDVVESDKEGSFFYISLAIIASMHYRFIKRKAKAQSDEPQLENPSYF